MIVSSVVNIVLDLLFVFPFGMGVFGAALATVLAQVVSALYCLVYIRRAAELLPRKQTGGQMVYFLAHSLEKACR